MTDFSSYLSEATPDSRMVPVCFDRQLLAELAEARRAIAEIEGNPIKGSKTLGDTDRQELVDRVAALEEEVRAKTRLLSFQNPGKRRWRDLIAEHPPTKEQRATYGALLHWDPDTFIPAAISLCAHDPEISVEEAASFIEQMPEGVVDRVWAAVLEVTLGGQTDPFVTASDGARAYSPK